MTYNVFSGTLNPTPLHPGLERPLPPQPGVATATPAWSGHCKEPAVEAVWCESCVCLVGVDVSERALVNLFDSFVVITSIASVFLCTRSVYRALQLGQVCVCVCLCVCSAICKPAVQLQQQASVITRMWANAQPDGCPAKQRWRPLFNAAKFG